jgi:hypothetical protein
VKTAQDSQLSKSSRAVLVTQSNAVREGEPFRDLEACYLVTVDVVFQLATVRMDLAVLV